MISTNFTAFYISLQFCIRLEGGGKRKETKQKTIASRERDDIFTFLPPTRKAWTISALCLQEDVQNGPNSHAKR